MSLLEGAKRRLEDDIAAGDRLFKVEPLDHNEGEWPAPLDLFSGTEVPSFPDGVLHDMLQEFSDTQGDALGTDAGAVATASLVVLAGLIPDPIQLAPRPRQTWTESTRLWAAIVGPVSARKSPVLKAALSPVNALDYQRRTDFEAEIKNLDEKEAAEWAPPPQHVVNDATTEAVQEILARQDKVIVFADELSGLLKRFDRYASRETGAREFWLECWNGGRFMVNRIKRGTLCVAQSACLLGGIQTDKLAKLVRNLGVDGLLQRFFVVNMRRAIAGADVDTRQVEREYKELCNHLSNMKRDEPLRLEFTDKARERFVEFDADSLDLVEAVEPTLPQLAGSVGKAAGQVVRLSLLLHVLDRACDHVRQHPGSPREFKLQPEPVTLTTLERAIDLWHFMFGQAYCFFQEFAGGVSEHVEGIARLILAKDWDRFTPSSITRHFKPGRNWNRREIADALEPLVLAGWLMVEGEPGMLPRAWLVNPRVRDLYSKVGAEERERRARIHKQFRALGDGP
jgi:hypothetical protein